MTYSPLFPSLKNTLTTVMHDFRPNSDLARKSYAEGGLRKRTPLYNTSISTISSFKFLSSTKIVLTMFNINRFWFSTIVRIQFLLNASVKFWFSTISGLAVQSFCPSQQTLWTSPLKSKPTSFKLLQNQLSMVLVSDLVYLVYFFRPMALPEAGPPAIFRVPLLVQKTKNRNIVLSHAELKDFKYF